MDEVEGQGHQIVASHVEASSQVDGLDDAALAGGARRRRTRAVPFSQLLKRAGAEVQISRAARVNLAELAAQRRTHKAFGPEPVPREPLLELLDVARLAPNHHLTQPWRFRVLGPEALARLEGVRRARRKR